MIRRAFALTAALAALTALATAPSARGNAAPPPRPVTPKDHNFVIEVDSNAKEARLIVPKKMAGGRAALDADTGGRFAADETRPTGHTVVAGTALALAVGCSGLWLVRRNRGAGRNLALLVAAGALLAGGVAAFADIAIPGQPRRQPPQRIPVQAGPQQVYSGKITVEVSESAEVVKLVLPPDAFRRAIGPGPAGGPPFRSGGAPPAAGSAPPANIPNDPPPKKPERE